MRTRDQRFLCLQLLLPCPCSLCLLTVLLHSLMIDECLVGLHRQDKLPLQNYGTLSPGRSQPRACDFYNSWATLLGDLAPRPPPRVIPSPRSATTVQELAMPPPMHCHVLVGEDDHMPQTLFLVWPCMRHRRRRRTMVCVTANGGGPVQVQALGGGLNQQR